jgi:peroxiredoxin Q/BCP
MKKLIILALLFTGLLQSCNGQHLAVGDMMPAFSLANQDGKVFNSADYVGKKILVVYFYKRPALLGIIMARLQRPVPLWPV